MVHSEISDVRYPVLVFIHHGGWHMLSGQSSLLGSRYLLDEDVVLVTMNYRLGALGEFPEHGRLGGPWRQRSVAALEWVRDNIAHFPMWSQSMGTALVLQAYSSIWSLLCLPVCELL
ncbi:hypothetical protein J437_LFUL014285 [Ladona fulva]|uniref:Carboxylesterase type B domain-containing protein n=1 Tax=Ladona fulva TaxID=123851 RepID=A0A8K0KIK2_LADFU|nr:hypothetical protein J437_LFUL014285 [Ladona fulva]